MFWLGFAVGFFVCFGLVVGAVVVIAGKNKRETEKYKKLGDSVKKELNAGINHEIEINGIAAAFESLCDAAQAAARSALGIAENLKRIIPLATIENYGRVYHLATHSKKARTRKKNMKRLLEIQY